MKRKRIFLVVAPIILTLSLALAFGGAVGVGQSAYGMVTLSRQSACPGSTVTASGIMLPGSTIHVDLLLNTISFDTGGLGFPDNGGQDQYQTGLAASSTAPRYIVELGNVDTDGAGSWSLTAVIPQTVHATAETQLVDTPTGLWTVSVMGTATGSSSVYSEQRTSLLITDCASSLPGTGFPYVFPATAVLLAAVFVAVAGYCGQRFLLARRRS